MTSKDMFDDVFPQSRQIGGSHYKKYPIQPYEFISKNKLSYYQGCVIKYVVRYLEKGGIQDLQKIIHFTELEILRLKDDNSKAKYRKK